jgi:hypothetical protein
MALRWGAVLATVVTLGGPIEARAGDVQLLDPSIFGRHTAEPVKPLFDQRRGDIAPAYVQLDILCGRYRAATVVYPESTSYSDVAASLARLYGRGEVGDLQDQKRKPWLWRIVDPEGWPLAVQLANQGNAPEVIYIKNAPWVRKCEAAASKQ